jgi:hypothetical protein
MLSYQDNGDSTDETFTGRFWINNKPIYKKTIYWDTPQYNMISINNVLTASLGFPDNIELVTNLDALLVSNTLKMVLSACTDVRCLYFNTDYSLIYSTSAGDTMSIQELKIEYTKTTD